MSALPIRRAGTRRATLPSLAIAGIGAALVVAAAAPAATGAARPAASPHHHSHHAKHVSVTGLVAHHAGRSVTVFAKTAKVGSRTMHNKRVHLTFARAVHHRTKMVVGDRIHVSAIGRAHGSHLTVMRHSDETVTPAPASLFFGTVVAISGNQLTVAEHDRDNGDGEQGDDHGHGGDGSDDSQSAAPADRGPGGSSGSGHQITVDDTNATITVDGSTDTPLVVGDTVAILGEATEDTIVAADIFGFTTAPDFLRGDVTAIDGNVVTLGDDQSGDSEDGDVADDHGGDDDQSVTVDLTNVPLALNGSLGSSPSDLTVGDKLVVLGSFDSTSGTFTPDAAFAFNGDDDQPCGDNGDDHGGHGHDGGGDD
jgi:hypothetical protein